MWSHNGLGAVEIEIDGLNFSGELFRHKNLAWRLKFKLSDGRGSFYTSNIKGKIRYKIFKLSEMFFGKSDSYESIVFSVDIYFAKELQRILSLKTTWISCTGDGFSQSTRSFEIISTKQVGDRTEFEVKV